jgi:hypothetical protein
MFGVSTEIVGLLSKLGDYLKAAIQRAAVLSSSGAPVDGEALAVWLEGQMGGWDPEIKGRKLADPATRRAAARFLAGIAVNLSQPARSAA